MDGFLDTVDALSSRKTREENLRILSDVHVGAFAVIRGVIYMIVMFALLAEAPFRLTLPLACGFILSRCVAIYALLLIPNAKGSGMLFEWQHQMHRPSFFRTYFTLIALVLSMERLGALLIALLVVASFLNFRRIARKNLAASRVI